MERALPENLTVQRLSERPDLLERAIEINDEVWPAFVDGTAASSTFWDAVYHEFPEFQFLVFDYGELVACGHTIPLWWDGTAEGLPTGWDDCLAQGVRRMRAGAPVNTLAGLATSMLPGARGKGISPFALGEMKNIARDYGLRAFIASVRPTMKCKHPEVPIDDYITWQDEDGRMFDPWLRTHDKLGAVLVGPANDAMVVDAPVDQWREWTGEEFPAGAQVLLPEALAPVFVSIDGSRARYREPNVWMIHGVGVTPFTGTPVKLATPDEPPCPT